MMNRTTRLSLAASLAAGFFLLSAYPASAAFDAATFRCRTAIAKSGTKLVKAALKALSDCHGARNRDPALVDTDCNFLATGDLGLAVGVAEAKFTLQVALRCATLADPADALYEACPAPCSDVVPTISSFADVSACLVCLNRARVEHFAQVAYAEPQSPLGSSAAACHRSLVSSGSRFFNSILKSVAKCQASAEKGGATTVDDCTDAGYDAIVAGAYDSAFSAIELGSCASLPFPAPTLDACGGAGNAPDLADCVLTTADGDGQTLVTEFLQLLTTTTTTTSTTTTTVPLGDAACPATAEIVLYSRETNTECTTNAECSAPRTCDTSIGKCTANTDVDRGWTGFAHNSDTNDEVRMRAHLYCEGPAGPTCGECAVAGIDPAPGNCRCANDSRQVCDEPFAASSNDCRVCVGGPVEGSTCGDDSDCSAAGTCARRCSNDASLTCSTNADCPGGSCRSLSDKRCSNGSSCETASDCLGTCPGTGGACDCYLGTPTPISMAGYTACIVDRLEQNISGTTDVDLGSSEIASSLITRLYLGELLASPCPTCGGTCSNNPATLCDRDLDCGGGTCTLDATAGDGLRGGTCSGGESEGLACDVTATNPSFPAFPIAEGAGGSGYSLDCMPSAGKNISGTGLAIDLTQRTGTSQLASNVSCTGINAGLDCPCLMCSADPTVACNDDVDCAGQRGSCSLSVATRCDVDGECSGVDAGYCNNIGRCSLAFSIHCASNADCDSVNVGTCNPSTCSSAGSGEPPLPNYCENLLCSDLGGGEGECTDGPDLSYCDGVVTAAGAGVYACSVDDDCEPATVGVDAGLCSLTQRLGCFLAPIVASGAADPLFPTTAAAFCSPPTHNSGLNALMGLPGPGRAIQQSALTTYCASNPLLPYTPGVGCP